MESITDEIRRRWGVFGSLAGGSILGRALPRLVEGGSFRYLGDIPELIPLVSVSIGGIQITQFGIVGLALEWLLISYLVFLSFPKILPLTEPAGEITDSRTLQVILTITVITLAKPVASYLPVAFSSTLPILQSSLGIGFLYFLLFWIVISLLVILVYIYISWWREASNEEKIDLVDQLSGGQLNQEQRDEEVRRLSKGGWESSTSKSLLLVGAAGRLLVICMLLGMVAGFANMLFPLLESGILAGAVVSLLNARFNVTHYHPGASLKRWSVDFEDRFLESARYVWQSQKGYFLILFVIGGGFVPATLLILFSIMGLYVFIWLAIQGAINLSRTSSAPLVLWNSFGYVICLAIPGLYSLWFWFRELIRIPDFLLEWENSWPGPSAITDAADFPEQLTRPPYFLIPVSILWIPIAIVTIPVFEPVTIVFQSPIFAISWPILLGLIFWTVQWTLSSKPQDPDTDGYAMQIAVITQYSWLWGLSQLMDDPFMSLETVIIVLLILLVLYYIPDLRNHLTACDILTDRYVMTSIAILVGFVFLGIGIWGQLPLSDMSQTLVHFTQIGGIFIISMAVIGSILIWIANRSGEA